MGLDLRWEQHLDRLPDDVRDFRLERAHDDGVLHQVVGVGAAPGIKTGPTRRPVDGHLSARVLNLDPPIDRV